MTQIDNDELEEIISEIADRIMGSNWEGVESLLDLIPETSNKEMLARKYLWKAKFLADKENDLDRAIHYLNLIKKEWSKNIYAECLLLAGRVEKKRKNFLGAENYWKKIGFDWNQSAYCWACWELMKKAYEAQEYNDAIEIVKNLQKNPINQKWLGTSHLWMARAYRKLKLKTEARNSLKNIPPKNKSATSWGLLEQYFLEADRESKLEILSKVNKDSDINSFNRAQFLLGHRKWRIDKESAIEHWLTVGKEDRWSYHMAQKKLLTVVVDYCVKSENYASMKKILEAIQLPKFKYDVEILGGIIEYSDPCRDNLFRLYRMVKKIKRELQIKSKTISQHCLKYAHYTSCSVAQIILGSEDNKTGNLQLSVADLMNDPTEGKVLYYILDKPEWLVHRFNHRLYQAYASCFSFNHDSLNQFRLYGKEAGREVTGVSMVFNLDMFSEEDFAGNISMNYFPQPVTHDKSKDANDNNAPVKLPLYQCVYYDPKSNYYKLASRSKMTFYREGKINHEKIGDVEDKWIEYSNEISKKESNLSYLFTELKVCINNLFSDYNYLGQAHQKSIVNLINNILLPVQFLIKHAAFMEEDECRILYIANAGSDVIQEKNGRLYIEYEPSVVEHLDKIYLSDGAKEERAFLERAWQKALDRDGITDKSIDIRDSDNPFRI